MYTPTLEPMKRRTKILLWIYIFIGVVTYGMIMRDCDFEKSNPEETGACVGYSLTFSVAWPLWWSEQLQK